MKQKAKEITLKERKTETIINLPNGLTLVIWRNGESIQICKDDSYISINDFNGETFRLLKDYFECA